MGQETSQDPGRTARWAGLSRYPLAFLAAGVALILRAVLDPLLEDRHVLLFPLLAVILVAWYGGGRPALLTLGLTLVGVTYFFFAPRTTLWIAGNDDRLALMVFLAIGLLCAVLGESQRTAHQKLQEYLTSLQQSEARKAAILDSALDCVITIDAQGRIVDFNPAAERTFGFRREEVLGQDMAQLIIPPEMREAHTAGMTRFLATGVGPILNRRMEWKALRQDGKEFPVEVSITPIAIGDSLLFTAYLRDISERKGAEEALRYSEARLRAVVETAVDAIITIGADGVIDSANEATSRLFGYEREELLGRNVRMLMPEPYRYEHDSYLANYLRTGERKVIGIGREAVGQRKDGTTFPLELAVSETRLGGRLMFTGIVRDSSERKRTEAALAERARLAALRADVGGMLGSGGSLRSVLQRTAEALIQHLEAPFAGIWVFREAEEMLELQGRAGQPTHLDGPQARIRVGEFKIGRIAQSRQPLLSNDVSHDPNFSNPEWAQREGIVAFAGFPLVVEGRLLGVLALFSRQALTPAILEDLKPLAENVAQYLDRKRAEAAFRESVERYRFLAETLPALVWSNRPDGTIDYLNSRWVEYTGLSSEKLGENRWIDIVYPEDQPRTTERWTRALQTGTKYQNEYRLRRADGVYRWFLAQALPMRDEEGRVIRWFGTNTDIDDQKRLQHDLRQTLDQFRALTEAIPQLVWTTDREGRITFFNRRWIDYTGQTVEQWAQEGWAAVVHPGDTDRLIERWTAAVREAADWFAMEYRLRRHDGVYRWHLSYAVPLRDAEGQPIQWVGALTDIDSQRRQAEILEQAVVERTVALTAANTALQQEVEERRRAEEQVQATATELRRSNEELEKFAYIASHDLQEPLRKIQQFGGRLRTKYLDRLDDAGREYLDRVLSSAGRMRTLIDDLLTFSRVTTKGQPFARVDLSTVAAMVLEDLEARIQETGGTVEVGPLPTIDADPLQMRQLLQNLLGNALKFHRPNVPPVVRVEGELLTDSPERELCRLRITDNGIGFEEKYLDRIFQVFQRLHGRHEYEGTGVGLAICRKIVERHGGEITATSTPGVGTTFLVTLPTRHATTTTPATET